MVLRLAFMGTPEFSVPVLDALIAAGHDVAVVYTQPPRPAGRGMALKASPVEQAARRYGLPVMSPLSFRQAADRDAFKAHGLDAAVVVAYGLLLPQAVLDAPRHGCFNIHASKLPRWRGAAPIQRAIMAGDRETAAMVMRMESGLDTGPVCWTEVVPIGAEITAGELHNALSIAGSRIIVDALAALEQGTLIGVPQPQDGVTYATKIDKSEARIDFNRSAAEVSCHIRGLSPFPGAWFECGPEDRPERIKVLRTRVVNASGLPGTIIDNTLTIACAAGAVQLLELQRAGKRPAGTTEFLRGFPLETGSVVR